MITSFRYREDRRSNDMIICHSVRNYLLPKHTCPRLAGAVSLFLQSSVGAGFGAIKCQEIKGFLRYVSSMQLNWLKFSRDISQQKRLLNITSVLVLVTLTWLEKLNLTKKKKNTTAYEFLSMDYVWYFKSFRPSRCLSYVVVKNMSFAWIFTAHQWGRRIETNEKVWY